MPNIIKLFIISCWLLVLSFNSVITQTPTFAVESTCDLCGWCNQSINPTPPPTWDKCHQCLYDAYGNEATGSYYTVLGCIATQPQAFVQSILSIVFGISGGIAFLAVLAGSGIVLTSAGSPERLQTGKDMIVSALFGILLILFSVFLLNFVGYDILRIPGLKK